MSCKIILKNLLIFLSKLKISYCLIKLFLHYTALVLSNTIKIFNKMEAFPIITLDKKKRNIPHTSKYQKVWLRAVKKISIQRMDSRLERIEKTQKSPYSNSTELIESYCKESQSQFLTDSKSFSQRLIIRPHQKPYIIWVILIGISLLYISTLGLLFAVFYDANTGPDIILVQLIEVLFIFDFIFKLNLAYIDQNFILVIDRKMILQNYGKVWIALDLFSSIPFSIIYSNTSQVEFFRMRLFFKLPRISSFFKTLDQLKTAVLIEFLVNIYHLELKLVKVLLISFLSLHIVACLFYAVGKNRIDKFESWIYQNNFTDCSIGEMYLNSLYFAVSTLTTVGYGDITPHTESEKIIAIIWMVFGVYMVSNVVGNLVEMYSEANKNLHILQKNCDFARKFVKHTKVDHLLYKRIRREIISKTGKMCKDTEKVLKMLSDDMKYLLVTNMHKKAILKIPFFSTKNEKFVISIGLKLEYLEINKTGVLYTEGDIANGVYFISIGQAKYYNSGIMFRVISNGEYFGDIELAFKLSRKFEIKVVEGLKLFKMRNSTVEEIQKDFPIEWKKMKEAAVKRSKNLIHSLTEMIMIKRVRNLIFEKVNFSEINKEADYLYHKIFNKAIHKDEKGEFHKLYKKLSQTKAAIKNSAKLLEIFEKAYEKYTP